MEKIIEIPEGYEARIEGNKVVLEPKEGEDERIREEIISALKFANDSGVYDKHIAYLEKQKEQKPAEWSEEDERMLDTVLDIILYNHKRRFCEGHQIYACWLNALVEKFKHCANETFNDEDEKHFNSFIYDVESGIIPYTNDIDWIKTRVKSLRPQPKQDILPSLREKELVCLKRTLDYLRREHNRYGGEDFTNEIAVLEWLITHPVLAHPHWKPSEEQIMAVEAAYSVLNSHDTWSEDEHLPILISLINDLKKLM